MKHLDLFSGIGGFALAARTVWGEEHEVVCFVEQDKFCQKVLRKHWPDVPIVEDVRDVNNILAYTTGNRHNRCSSRSGMEGEQPEDKKQSGSRWSSQTNQSCEGNRKREYSYPKNTSTNIDLLTGGFPCQGFSVAGKRRGKEDDRYLWPEMFEVIKAVRPRWVIGENVAGIVNMALDTVLSDLEDQGYATQAFIIPACAQNAPHRRDRVWIVAHTGHLCRGNSIKGNAGIFSREQAETSIRNAPQSETTRSSEGNKVVADSFSGKRTKGREGIRTSSLYVLEPFSPGWWTVEPNMGRVAHGIPSRVDRLKSLGNAIVPQVVVPIMQAIKNLKY